MFFQCFHRIEGLLFDLKIEFSADSGSSHDPEGIFIKAFVGISDRSDDPIFKVLFTVMIVDDLSADRRSGECVDREITALEIPFQGWNEGNGGGSSSILVFPFASERGHLVVLSLKDDGDGPMGDSRRNDGSKESDDIVGACIGGEVQIRVPQTQEKVTNRTADDEKRKAAVVKDRCKAFDSARYRKGSHIMTVLAHEDEVNGSSRLSFS
ncbi:MAG: hypothetical protein BWY50_02128 [Spirochaetes bacterium ADurb.Bin315]|nr:MAG: hypothetical protein BWY50_02128 [Spirochaetes bacterium ADurb.Bin315]